MKFSKDWTYIKIILLIVLIILIIYKLNGTNETFQNNQNNQNEQIVDNNVLLQEISSLLDIQEERIENIKISGLDPDIRITFHIIPREINDTESATLESINETIKTLKSTMNYQFTIEGEMKNFTDILVNPIEKVKLTKFEKLQHRFINPNINEQINHLKDVKNYIKNDIYIKHNNPMDRFYGFDKYGNLKVEDEIQNPEITEPQTENGILED